jgi:tRNA pseudouridine32 synthase/23S rRNA pseudouridine746 synthase
MQMNTVFKNNHFVVVNKPAGTLSTPSRMGRTDPRPVIGILLQQNLGQKIYPVHRLDEEVSGLLLFAWNDSAHKAANRWFELHEVRKTYEAISVVPSIGPPFKPGEVNIWKSKLMRGKKRAYEADYGKESVTKSKLVTFDANRSIWHLQPLTGRSHQLRYEMSKHGYPINGDGLYGSAHPHQEDGSIALRAVHLDFSAANQHGDFGLPTALSLKSIEPITLM